MNESNLQPEEYQLELENRIKNLMWTVSGDYAQQAKVDIESFRRSKYIALYDGIKQGAFAHYFDKDAVGLYLVKKVYLQADETELVRIAQMCIDVSTSDLLCCERRGIATIRRKALSDTLDTEFDTLAASHTGRLKIALIREYLDGSYTVEKQIRACMEQIYELRDTLDRIAPESPRAISSKPHPAAQPHQDADGAAEASCVPEPSPSRRLIEVIDAIYNRLADPDFEQKRGTLDSVLAVTLDELTEYSWKDYLSEDMYEENLETYLQQMTNQMTGTESEKDLPEEEEDEEQKKSKKRVLLVDEESLKKVYSYIELNYGRTYLTPLEEKRINFQLCKGVHADCSLYFTEGILSNAVRRNYQYAYAERQKDKNRFAYYDNHRVVKQNIKTLLELLRKTMLLRDEQLEVISDRGSLIPALLWKVGRTSDARLFRKVLKNDSSEMVVDVLIDASGSQQVRQAQVAMQAYIISEALSQVGIPQRVMSFCTFWDYTILHRFRDYNDPREANDHIFEYTTSSNNRDGLAIRAASDALLQRDEEHKIMIILSDGRPYDVILNRPNAKNPQPYQGKTAVRDTGFEVRRLRNLGVAVLGVFAGEEKDLEAEKKIFGRDFAYIRDISVFSKVVGRYLMRHLSGE